MTDTALLSALNHGLNSRSIHERNQNTLSQYRTIAKKMTVLCLRGDLGESTEVAEVDFAAINTQEATTPKRQEKEAPERRAISRRVSCGTMFNPGQNRAEIKYPRFATKYPCPTEF